MDSPKLKKPKFVKVSDLTPDSHGHNLIVKVVKTVIASEKTRPDKTKIRIAEVTVGDETGEVIISARNEQIDVLIPGTTIAVRNAKIIMFKGFMRLVIDKWGQIKEEESANFEVNSQNNISDQEYEQITVYVNNQNNS